MHEKLIKIAQSGWYLLYLFAQLSALIGYYLVINSHPLLLLPILTTGALTVFLLEDYLARMYKK